MCHNSSRCWGQGSELKNSLLLWKSYSHEENMVNKEADYPVPVDSSGAMKELEQDNIHTDWRCGALLGRKICAGLFWGGGMWAETSMVWADIHRYFLVAEVTVQFGGIAEEKLLGGRKIKNVLSLRTLRPLGLGREFDFLSSTLENHDKICFVLEKSIILTTAWRKCCRRVRLDWWFHQACFRHRPWTCSCNFFV